MDPQIVAQYTDYGALGLTIVGLISLLGVMAAVVRWAIGKWQKAEDQVDAEKEKRLVDTGAQAVLGVEFKNATMAQVEAVRQNTAEVAKNTDKVEDLAGQVGRLREDVAIIRAELNARPARRGA